jgi:hypothetical protein
MYYSTREFLNYLEVVLAHYDALPVLIDFVSRRASDGDPEAMETLLKWDTARNNKLS